MEPVTVGVITITACEYQGNGDDEGPDNFPEFRVKGKVRVRDAEHAFERLVSVELDGRDAEQDHVSGFDLDTLTYDEDQGLRAQVEQDLYNALYQTTAYNEAIEALNSYEEEED